MTPTASNPMNSPFSAFTSSPGDESALRRAVTKAYRRSEQHAVQPSRHRRHWSPFLGYVAVCNPDRIVTRAYCAQGPCPGTTAVTIRQRAVPKEFQGRVGSVYMTGVFGGLVVGSALGGVIADEIGRAHV